MRERASLSGSVALAWGIAYVALGLVRDLPGSESLGLSGWADTLAHFLATALLAALVRVWQQTSGDGRSSSAWAVALATAVGLGIEILQTQVPGRSFEAADLLADFLGAVAGVTVYRILSPVAWRDQAIRSGGVVITVAAVTYLLAGALGG